MSSYNENRNDERVSLEAEILCFNCYNPDGELIRYEQPINMEAFDISMGGVGFVAKEAFEDGSILNFTLYLEEAPYNVIAKVKWHESKSLYNRYGVELVSFNDRFYNHLESFTNGVNKR